MYWQLPSNGAKRNRVSSDKGFTLIEAMFVAVILATLVALAIPTYMDQVRKARRADAESSLLQAAQTLERCFTRFNAYNADGCPNPAGASMDGFYQISLQRNATTYTITAAPQADQSLDACGDYSLDHLGNRTPEANGNRCWGASG